MRRMISREGIRKDEIRLSLSKQILIITTGLNESEAYSVVLGLLIVLVSVVTEHHDSHSVAWCLFVGLLV
jgi:hypothetical protein